MYELGTLPLTRPLERFVRRHRSPRQAGVPLASMRQRAACVALPSLAEGRRPGKGLNPAPRHNPDRRLLDCSYCGHRRKEIATHHRDRGIHAKLARYLNARGRT